MGSTRLPGKVLKVLNGKPFLQHIVERVRSCFGIHSVWIATSDRSEDDDIEELTRVIDCPVFRGSANNVLERYAHAAGAAGADIIVRICGDNPCVDPYLIDAMVARFLSFHGSARALDYMNNLETGHYAEGLAVEIMTSAALLDAHNNATDTYDREHVTPYIRTHPQKYRLYVYNEGLSSNRLRLTVDTADDFEFIRKLYSVLYDEARPFSIDDVLDHTCLTEVSTFSSDEDDR